MRSIYDLQIKMQQDLSQISNAITELDRKMEEVVGVGSEDLSYESSSGGDISGDDTSDGDADSDGDYR